MAEFQKAINIEVTVYGPGELPPGSGTVDPSIIIDTINDYLESRKDEFSGISKEEAKTLVEEALVAIKETEAGLELGKVGYIERSGDSIAFYDSREKNTIIAAFVDFFKPAVTETYITKLQADGFYAQKVHNHDGVYQPKGEYLTEHLTADEIRAMGFGDGTVDETQVNSLIDQKLIPVNAGLSELGDDVDGLKEDLSDYDERIKALEEGGSAGGATGFSQAFVTAMTNFVKHVLYDHEEDGSVYGDALIRSMSVAPGEGVKLERISVVANKTTADEGSLAQDLDLTVTAHYSDGTESEVFGWTATGTIAVGSNTITVKYGGKSATVTITGVKVVKYVLTPDTARTTFQAGNIFSDMGNTVLDSSKRAVGLNCSNVYEDSHDVKLSFIASTNYWNGGFVGVLKETDLTTTDRFISTLSTIKMYNAQKGSSWLVDKEYSYNVTVPSGYCLVIGCINGDPTLFDISAVTIEVIS